MICQSLHESGRSRGQAAAAATGAPATAEAAAAEDSIQVIRKQQLTVRNQTGSSVCHCHVSSNLP